MVISNGFFGRRAIKPSQLVNGFEIYKVEEKMKKAWIRKNVLISLLILTLLWIGPEIVSPQEPVVTPKEGKIIELNFGSGYLVLSEEKIFFDSKTLVTNEEDEVKNIKNLKLGLEVLAYVVQDNGDLRAVQIEYLSEDFVVPTR